MQAESSRATLRDLLRTHNLRPVEQASGACPRLQRIVAAHVFAAAAAAAVSCL